MKKIFLILTVVVGLVACEADDYLVDGGVSDPNVGMSTMDFLKSHYQLDTLALLLERGGFADDVNGNTTLFAPNNLSIRKYVNAILAEMRETDANAEFTVDDIPVDTLQKHLGAYIFSGKITREVMKEEGEVYTAINSEQRIISLEPTEQYTNQLSEYPEYVYYTYPNDGKSIVVRTSNLISTNGVIHVLQGSHILFDYDN